MNPLTVRVFDDSRGCVCTRFLDMCLTSGTDAGTAAKIFEAMDAALQSRDIPWVNFIGLSVDNISVNMGNLISCCSEESKWLSMSHCPQYCSESWTSIL